MIIDINHGGTDFLSRYGLTYDELSAAGDQLMRILLEGDTTPISDYDKEMLCVIFGHKIIGPSQVFVISKIGMQRFADEAIDVTHCVEFLIQYKDDAIAALRCALCAEIALDNANPNITQLAELLQNS